MAEKSKNFDNLNCLGNRYLIKNYFLLLINVKFLLTAYLLVVCNNVCVDLVFFPTSICFFYLKLLYY